MRGQGHWAEGVPEETLTRAQAQQELGELALHASHPPDVVCDDRDVHRPGGPLILGLGLAVGSHGATGLPGWP